MKKHKGKSAVLEQLLKTPVIEVACSKSGIGRTTLYRWKQEDPEFAKAVEEATREGYEFISDVAESQLVNLIKKGNFSAVAYWLKHNRTERYGEKIQLSGEVSIREELTDEELNLIRQALTNIIGTNIQNHEQESRNSAGENPQQ